MLGFVAAPLSAQNTLTVADGTETNDYVPFYGYYMNSEEHTQIIFPDSMLADMQGYAITQMEFYLSSNPSFTSTITISLGISTNPSFSGETFDNETTLTEVYSGAIVIANNVMTVEFDSPFNYSGGNLLFDLTNTSGNYTSASFYGITSTGASLNDYSYNWGSVQKNFIPKTTFSYGTPSLCSKPTGLTVTAITTNSATISWLGSDNASSYNVEYMLSTESDWANAQSITAYDTTVDLSGLNPSSSYKVRVQTVCSDNTETNWSLVKNFLTSCDAITITDSWFEDFEGYAGSGEQPFNCWATPVTTPGGGPFVYCGYGQSCHSGVNSAELKGYTNMLVLPEFTNDLHTLRMTFWATNYGSGTSAVVGVITDISDTSTFEVLGDAGTPGPRGSANAGNGNLMGPFDFNSVEATTGRIAILFNGPGTSSGWNLDDFTVTFIPACAEPTGLANVNVAATAADLTWNEVDGSTYDLVYWENSGEDTTVVYGASLTDNVYTLTDLNPSSSYTWYVRTDCGDGTYALSFAQLTFSTPGLPVELPYARTFEEGEDNPVTEFTFQGSGDNQWAVGTATFNPDADDPTAEGHSLYISNDNGVTNNYNTSNTSYAYAILNVSFDESLEYHLAFDYKTMGEGGSYTIYDYLSVYLMDASAEVPTNAVPSGTTLLSQKYNVGDWTHADFLLENVAGTSKKIVFFWKNDGTSGTNPPAAIDNISIQGFACAQPSNLTASNITSSSATLNWQENGSATAWNVYYRPVGGSEWSMETATDESLEISGLGGNIKYEFYVTADCSGEESNPSATVEFRTLCGDEGISVLPFSEDFEGEPVDGYVVCWTRSTNDSTGSHQVYLNTTDVYYFGSKVLDFGYTPGCYTQAILPMFDNSLPLNSLKVEFDARRGNTDGAFLIGALTDPTDDDTFEVIDTIVTSSNNSWNHITVYCNNYTGSGQYLAFRADNCGNSARLIDNLVIDYLPECLPISNLYVSDLTMAGATISWSGNADSYNVYVGGNIYNTTDTFIVINDLNASSSYTVSVRALCAADSSVMSEAISFNTSCGAITVTEETPWFEDFEGYPGGGTQPFICWETPQTYTASNGVFPGVYCGHSPSCHSGANSAEFKGDAIMLALPEFSNDLSELRLSFWATAVPHPGTGSVEIGYITNVTDISTFVFLADAGTPGPRGSSGSGHGNFMGPFDFNGVTAPTGARIALRYTNASDPTASWNLDDFTVGLVPDCPSPVKTSVTATNVDGHNATISWTDNDPTHTAWTVYYKASTDSEWSTESASATTVDLTGLDPETTYDVYVVTDCGTAVDNPDATLTIHFTTLVACPAPQNLTVSNIGMTSATVTWFSNADSYTIEYGEAGFTPGEGTTDVAYTTTLDLSGLTSGSAYTVYVTADCGADGTSQTATVNFNTSLCEVEDQCAYTFNLTDSYGDGWNGGTLAVQQNGITVATLGLLSGSSATETVNLCHGVSTDLVWTAGSYANEASFTVSDPFGAELYASTSMSSGTNTVYTFMPNCSGCAMPSGLTVSGIDANSATISWTGSADSYTVEYGETGFTPGTGTSATVTSTTYNLTGLNAATYYTIYVNADCGAEGTSSPATVSFMTACETVITYPYTDGFENGLGCWVSTPISGSSNWATTNSYNNSSTLPEGSSCVAVSSTTHGYQTELASPIFDLTSLTNPYLSFYHIQAVWAGDQDNLFVYYKTSPTAELELLTSFTDDISSWQFDSIALPNPTSTYQLIFKAALEYGHGVGLDNVMIYDNDGTPPVVCNTPTNLTVNSITDNSAVATWTAGGDETAWNVQYKAASATNWTTATASTTSYTMNSLTAGTQYQVRVQADCGDSESAWTTTVSFTTTGGTVVTDPTVATNTASAVEQTTATLNATITNPDNVSITAKGFEWKATTGGTYTQISGTGTGNTFTANLSGLTANTNYTYKAFITFNGTTVYGNEMTFTTLPEDTPEPCETPTNLRETGVIIHKSIGYLFVVWDDHANASQWNLQYKLSSENNWTNVVVTGNPTYTFENLEAYSEYNLRVQAICDENNLSEWSNVLTATAQGVGINDYLLNSITLYPNPANDVVNVQCTMNNVQCLGIEVFDVFGKLINTVNVTENTTRINVSGLANGIYFVRVTTDAGTVTKSFVKK